MRPHNTEAIRSGMTAPHADTARQARRIAGLRGNSLGISLMLIAEYGLGIGVSLYVHIPAADPGEHARVRARAGASNAGYLAGRRSDIPGADPKRRTSVGGWCPGRRAGRGGAGRGS